MRAAVRRVFDEVDRVAVERGLDPLGPRLLGPVPPTGRDLAGAPVGTAQLVVFGASLAVHQALCHTYGVPSAVVGVSFGEIAALSAAGILTVGDGARAAHDLALVLASCAGGLTLLCCSQRSAHDLLTRVQAREATIAVVNDDRSVLIAGSLPELTCVEKAAADAGVTAVRLRLPFTSHHPSLTDQAEAFAKALTAYHQAEPLCPVYSAVAGRAYNGSDDLARRLADCLIRPAVIPPVLRHVVTAHRPDALFEAGTGSALATSARRVLSDGAAPAVHAPLAEPAFAW
ncbi:acyltransferase domain-containing protein [Streptomyces sp. NPDC001401]|uniref:acyltransferase domain-containing protein n=1 Tax=Streptomyces sp. NPDC001401 TaxID=3364570 RepID=UPI0036930999